MPTPRPHLLLAFTSLLVSTLSCAVVPTPRASAPDPLDVAAAPARVEEIAEDLGERDSDGAAVLAHLLRHRHRTGLTDEELAVLADTIVAEARCHDFDPALVLAVMHVESRYDAFAVSPKDALGLMQLLPSTGAWLAPSADVAWIGPQTLFDPIANVRLGVAYLRLLTDRYGSVRTALVAYNWGPGRIDGFLRDGRPLPPEYAALVMTAYELRARSS